MHLIYLTLTAISGTPTLGEVNEKTGGGREREAGRGARELGGWGEERWEGGGKRGGGKAKIKLGRCLVAPVLGAEGAVCHHFLCPHETGGRAMPAWRYAVFSPGC